MSFPEMPQEEWNYHYNVDYVDKKQIPLSGIKETVKSMVITDTHGYLLNEKAKQSLIENMDGIQLIICLGDIRRDELKIIEKEALNHNIPLIGIKGNHDLPNQFEGINIKNMHLEHTELFGIKFFGFEGSIKYNESIIGFSQEESKELLEEQEKCDVFLTHCRPWLEQDENLGQYNSHTGLIGIRGYIERNHPVNLCGHNHERMYYKELNSHMLYGISLITFLPKN